MSADASKTSALQLLPTDTYEADGDFGSLTSGADTEIGVAGLYLCIANVAIAGAGNPYVLLRLNGVNIVYQASVQAASVARVLQADVGDVIGAYMVLPGTRTVDHVGTNFQVVRIGPVRWT